MAPIIRAAPVSAASRQLRRPAAVGAPVVVTPVRTPVPVADTAPLPSPLPATPAPDVTQPEALQRQVSAQREQAERLQAREQALAIAQAALAEREQQLHAAQQRLDEQAADILADAERRGLEQGQQNGAEQARAAVSAQLALLEAVVQSAQEARAGQLEEQRDALVEIAFTAVCRVLGERATSRDSILAMVDQLVGAQHAGEPLTVRLHPQDAALLAADADAGRAGLQFLGDASVVLGGCLLDSPRGTLDARLELQVGQLRAALLAARQQAPQEQGR